MKLILVSLVTIILLTSIIAHESFAKSKDSKAKNDIIKKLGRAVEGHYAVIDMLNISKFNDNATITVINKTGGTSPPPPPTPTCMSGWHYDPVSKECVQDNVPPPPPVSGFKLCMAGDFKDSSVFDAMKKQCNFRIALGDMGYNSDLSLVKKIAPDRCVIGNHDSPEDGSSAIYKEALSYCGNSWWQKIGSGTVVLGFNTNGEISAQLKGAQNILSNATLMNGVKNIISVSHKNGHVFPSAHHPAEATALYSQLETMIPNGIKLYQISGHNHDMASANNGLWYIAGAGGKSHYSCGTGSVWTFCDNTHNGFLQFTIDNQGSITPNFYDTSNKIIH